MTDHPLASAGAAGDGWGPATSVRVGEGRRTSTRDTAEPAAERRSAPNGSATRRAERSAPRAGARSAAQRSAADAAWSPAGPLSGHDQRATRRAERAQERERVARERAGFRESQLQVERAPERGLPWWASLGLLVVIAVLGVIIDSLSSSQARSGFNIGIVVASIVAIFAVKRSHMFAVVIAPPIVYSVVAMVQLYSASGGLHDKKAVFDSAANYLVYGFPAIAAATAAVLIIAGIRLIARK